MKAILKSSLVGAFAGFGLAAIGAIGAVAAPVEYVKLCDAYGIQYIYVPGTETCLNVDTGETRLATLSGTVEGQSVLKEQADAAEAGAAVAIALPNATVDDGKTFGLSANYGAYGDSSALGLSGAIEAMDGLTINAGAGISTSGGQAGGRVGVNFSW